LALLEAIESSKRFNDKLDNVELKSNNWLDIIYYN
jgi:hypothetical protein